MSETRKGALAVFDLCETLCSENTTLGFVRFFQARHGSWSGRLTLALVHSRGLPVFYLFAALHRFGSLDLFRWALARMLRGRSRSELAAAAKLYATEALGQRAIAETQDALARHRAAGDRVVIVSNSLDLIVEAVAERLGTEWRASRLGFSGGLCTGRIDHDLTGRKAGVVSELLGEYPERPVLHAYTDNISDRDLVEIADFPTIVIPTGRSRARWGDVNAVFVEL